MLLKSLQVHPPARLKFGFHQQFYLYDKNFIYITACASLIIWLKRTPRRFISSLASELKPKITCSLITFRNGTGHGKSCMNFKVLNTQTLVIEMHINI
jgi:hypothetical protein